MPPRFLYFDLGNVLLKFDHQIACRQMAEAAGVEPEVVWKTSFQGPMFLQYERGEISSEEYYERFCEATGSRPDRAALELAASDIFQVNAPTIALVGRLKLAGCRMGILSNTNEAHWKFIDRDHYGVLADRWEQYALSFRLQSLKPEPEIYHAAAEMAGVPPEEIFFVDDRPENVEGARRAGFDAVPFTTAAALAADLLQRGVRFNF